MAALLLRPHNLGGSGPECDPVSRLTNLIRQVVGLDPQLGADLKREVDALSGRRAFGLNFERHIPETVELPHRPVRRGDKVRCLPARGGEAADTSEQS